MRIVARCVVVILLLSLVGCSFYKERPAKDFAGATGGEALENVFWTSLKAKDWAAIENVLASNFAGLNPDGNFTAATWMERLKQVDLQDYTVGSMQTELNGDTFVVTYDVTMTGTIAGQPIPAKPAHRMSVWQRQTSGWVLIAQSAS
jgi:hypothetical protein